MRFLYPKSRQFPFDEVCEQIVRALHARDWRVPSFEVAFHDYGSGELKFRHVDKIKSDALDVEIWFCRSQGRLPDSQWDDVAAARTVSLPRRILRVHEDESGPSLSVYVGDCWERDRATNWDHFNAKLDGHPRTCVRYTGSSFFRNMRPPSLVADEDGREYAPEGDEPWSLSTAQIMEEVRAYLHDVVLRTLEETPVADTITDVCAEPPAIPLPDGVGPFFTYGEPRDADRIERGKKSLTDLPAAERYGMSGCGRRLVPTHLKRADDLPEVAYDGFLWCGITSRVPGDHAHAVDNRLIKITPRDARGIYVADHAAYEKCRATILGKIKDRRDYFTKAEVSVFLRARGRSIVSILEYKNDYEDPVYLINRELALDEVEVIGQRAR